MSDKWIPTADCPTNNSSYFTLVRTSVPLIKAVIVIVAYCSCCRSRRHHSRPRRRCLYEY